MKKLLLLLLMSNFAFASGQFHLPNGLLVGNGTVSVPSIGFDSDDDGSGTGIYRIGANNLGFSANGTAIGNISAAGLWTIGANASTQVHVINGLVNMVNGALVPVVNKNTTYVITTADQVIFNDATSAGYTVTLPAANAAAGKTIEIVKTDSSTNAVTIARAGSDTIEGATSRLLTMQYEKVVLLSDGSGTWYMRAHEYPRGWQAYTPTGAWSTNSTYTGKWRRVGANMEIQVMIALAGAPTSAALYINMPTGYTVDTAQMVDAVGNVTSLGRIAIYDDSGNGDYFGSVTYRDTTSAWIDRLTTDATGGTTQPSFHSTVSATNPVTFANNDKVHAYWSVPITNWF